LEGTLLQLAWGISDQNREFFVPVLDGDYLIFHKQNVEVYVEEEEFLHHQE
jgi:hypothetical protein